MSNKTNVFQIKDGTVTPTGITPSQIDLYTGIANQYPSVFGERKTADIAKYTKNWERESRRQPSGISYPQLNKPMLTKDFDMPKRIEDHLSVEVIGDLPLGYTLQSFGRNSDNQPIETGFNYIVDGSNPCGEFNLNCEKLNAGTFALVINKSGRDIELNNESGELVKVVSSEEVVAVVAREVSEGSVIITISNIQYDVNPTEESIIE